MHRRAVVAGALGAAAVSALAAPARRVPRVPAFSAHAVTVIGHRGARGRAPENTLPAFRRGIELGADALELDLRLSADGEVVVMHDPTVDRTTDGMGAVADLSLSDLRGLDAGYRWQDADGGHPFRGAGLKVPTLSEVLDAVDGTFLVLELKVEAGPALARSTADTLRRHGRTGDALVASEDTTLLREARAALPGVASSMSETEVRRLYALHLSLTHRRWRPPGQVVQVPETHDGRRIVTPRFIRAAHDLGLDVQVWTVNDPAEMARLIEWGVDGLVTDYPDRAATVVSTMGR